MINNIITLDAASPENLEKALNDLKNIGPLRSEYVSLAICGPEVLITPFSFSNIPLKDLKKRIEMEGVELLNLPASDIEIDYQIFSSTDDEIKGIFACTPKTLIQKYLKVIAGAGLVPLKITPYILAAIDSFILEQNEQEGRFAFLDFSKQGYVNLAVMSNYSLELLRKVPYESIEEAKLEVIQSLRSACANSHVKEFDHIYLTGDISSDSSLISELKRIFNGQSQCQQTVDITPALSSESNFFSINLIRHYALSNRQRTNILRVTNIFLAIFFLGCMSLAVKIHKTGTQIKNYSEAKKPVPGYDKLASSKASR